MSSLTSPDGIKAEVDKLRGLANSAIAGDDEALADWREAMTPQSGAVLLDLLVSASVQVAALQKENAALTKAVAKLATEWSR